MKKLLIGGLIAVAGFFAGAYTQKEKNVLAGTKKTFEDLKEKGADLYNKAKDGFKNFMKKEEKAAEEVVEEAKKAAEEVKETVAEEKPAE